MASTNEIKKLQADLKANPELAKRINSSVLDILINLLKVLGYNISKEDLDEAVKLSGGPDSTDLLIVWDNYIIIN